MHPRLFGGKEVTDRSPPPRPTHTDTPHGTGVEQALLPLVLALYLRHAPDRRCERSERKGDASPLYQNGSNCVRNGRPALRGFIAQRPATEGNEVELRIMRFT